MWGGQDHRMSTDVPSRRVLGAEALGTGALVCVVIGSGILGSQLSRDFGVVLVINMVATILGLGLLIYLLQPVSGAVFNPVITVVLWRRGAMSGRSASTLSLTQIVGACLGALVANIMFNRPAVSISSTSRSTIGEFLAEIIATAGLAAAVSACLDRGAASALVFVVPAWIGSAYLFTSSTSFANPAVTMGRTLSDSFAGIAPSSAGIFLIAQVMGGVLGYAVARSWGTSRVEQR